jgi:transcriptional regulator with XRE-family HTH domain
MSNGLKQDISIGHNLRRLRKQAGLTQGQVSAKLEIMGLTMTPEIYAKIEQGKYSIKISVLLALKDIYHINSFDSFFEGLSLHDDND